MTPADELPRRLSAAVAGEVRFDRLSRGLYATDASHYEVAPLGVVVPRDEADVVATVSICAELGVPLTARGGGTSLSGQSVGAGVILDDSKYFNAVERIDPATKTAWVRPGVVLDHLNAALAPHGLLFGPDVATANRATLGGMIGNNSAGSRSVVYGKTGDHVRSLRVALADGSVHTLGPLDDAGWAGFARQGGLLGDGAAALQRVVRNLAAEIPARFPAIPRRVSGYNLAAYVPPEFRGWSLVPLVVGSEGTLAVVLQAELALVDRPKHRALVVPHFDSLDAALECVGACLAHQPSAVELIDRMLIELARGQRSTRAVAGRITGSPEALLFVEISGDEAGDVAARARRVAAELRASRGCFAALEESDPAVRDALWAMRSSAVPLLWGLPGDRKPVTFVEDTAVAPAVLPAFARRFRELLATHGTHGAFYGHASVGCLHIRPVLDLKSASDLAMMRRITADVVALVREFGGTLSGEHGDGMVRSEWNRALYGDAIADAFVAIKRAFDPKGILNPGKVVDAAPMERGLRPFPLPVRGEPATVFDYSAQGGFFASVEACNGAGVCRKTQGGAMCPSYRATLDERDTTRGRANALRLALVAEPNDLPRALGERWIEGAMDLCLSCKACKRECPASVDLAKLKAEYQHARYRNRRRPMGHLLARHAHAVHRLGAALAPLSNALTKLPFARTLMQATLGIDARRSLPEFRRDHFRRRFARHVPPAAGTRVLLLADCFTTYTEPEIGSAALAVLEATGCRVELAPLECCGRAMLSKGYLADAKALVRRQADRLAAAVADGTPLLGLEPSCLVALMDEWPELVPGPATRRIADACRLVEDYAAPTRLSGEWVFHPHCHQRAVIGVSESPAWTTLDAGCCGMAGSFGFEREHFDISVRIAGLQLVPELAKRPNAAILANGTSCRHQIRDLTGRRVAHPVEALARCLSEPEASAREGSHVRS